jgi:SAM-dependent methyltransferase
MPIVDVVERPVLAARGLTHLPRFSVRVRSTGLTGQFGGRVFADGGTRALEQLRKYAGLQRPHRMLDIGCGAGRVAFGVVGYLGPGGYVGLDVDVVQIRSCLRNGVLQDAGFEFVLAEVANDLYNPEGRPATTYRLPFDDGTFDVVHLISVFTHMRPADVAAYAPEIMRVLKPGGRAMLSIYAKDGLPKIASAMSFAHPYENSAWVEHPGTPLKAVAYAIETMDAWFGQGHEQFHLGSWRDGLASDILQDMLVYMRK